MPEPTTSQPAAEAAPPSPDLERTAERLLGGAGKMDPVEVSLDTPGEPKTPESRPPDDNTRQELEDLKRRTEAAEKRANDNQSYARQNEALANQYQEQIRAYQEQSRRDGQAAESLRQLQPPTMDEDDLVDPAKVKEYIESYGEYNKQLAAAMVWPQLQQVNRTAKRIGAMSEFMVSQTLDQGAEEVKGIFPGANDFDEYRDEIKSHFEAMGDEGMDLMSKPNMVKNAYVLIKTNRGEPLVSPQASDPPPSLPTRRERRETSGDELARMKGKHGELMSEVLGKLGVEKVSVSEDDLDMLREGGL